MVLVSPDITLNIVFYSDRIFVIQEAEDNLQRRLFTVQNIREEYLKIICYNNKK